ncbi:MAG TPA: NADH-quinone oxidoreductase subunit NuoH [Bacteroidota bacterium]|nr:NADH-quinone oxidoreductase subunit NuoH [Bacteroidota bacterium]
MNQLLQSFFGDTLLTHIVMSALPLLFVLVCALVTIYVEMKMAAHMQDRVAYMRTGWHGTLQPFADILKLLQKEDIIPAAADKLLFMLAPYIVFIGTYAAFAALPFSSAYVGSSVDLGLFYIIAVSALVVIGILMAGWASNNKWSLFGAIRSASQIISYEIPAALAVLAVVMITGSLNMDAISKFQQGGVQNWLVFGGPLPIVQKLLLIPIMLTLAVIYYVCSMAEVNRTPFDIPEAESELVQGYNTEFTGMKFALFYLAEYANLFVVSAIAVVLFFGGWSSPFGSFMSGPVWDAFWFITKGMIFVCVNIWLRWTLPRLRVDQLMYVSWKVLVPFALVCVVLVGAIMVM